MYQRIKDLREDKDLSQTEMGRILGMSQTGYSEYETGENDVPTGILIKLADFHNTSVDCILGGQKRKSPIPGNQSAKRLKSLEYNFSHLEFMKLFRKYC